MSEEQYERYAVEGEEINFYGTSVKLPAGIYGILGEIGRDMGFDNITTQEWKSYVGDMCLEMINNPKRDVSMSMIVIGIIMMIFLFIS